MKHKRKSNNLIIFLILATILLVSFLVFKQKAHAPLNKLEGINQVNNAVDNTNKTDDTPLSVKAEQAGQSIAQNLEIPILMYHYIRTVDDPNDKLGINLSVTPDKFAKQLDLIASQGYTTVTFNDLAKNNVPLKPIILTFDDGYKDFYTNAYPELKKHNMTAVSYIIADKDNTQYMSKKEILEISQNNIEIGSHTLSHPDLSRLSADMAQNEIIKSKEKIENIIGKKVLSFCYPAGKYNDTTLGIVKSAGYDYAVTTNPGIGQLKNPLILSRYRVNADTNISIYLK